jgi:hypothetical protein|tara:strand:+ start:1495 stop:1638 length:144 start_codon:yes stop_codon:yes gene_type:complete
VTCACAGATETTTKITSDKKIGIPFKLSLIIFFIIVVVVVVVVVVVE